jgi:hypothetical protein
MSLPIADCRLPIVVFEESMTPAIGIWQSAIGNEPTPVSLCVAVARPG